MECGRMDRAIVAAAGSPELPGGSFTAGDGHHAALAFCDTRHACRLLAHGTVTVQGSTELCFPVKMRTSRRIHRKAGSSEGNLMKPPSCLLAVL
jgi:hypothetical protein